ncbi:MAG: hypothetical protein QF467_07295 [SAR202 cluster bacterium]|jgi:hypothetical protein|nr:hypothetical protein [SAR202 cluster bacterium]
MKASGEFPVASWTRRVSGRLRADRLDVGQRPLHLAIALSLVALLIATYVARTVDLFSWDVDITQ